MINTWGELWEAIKTWLDTPLERKPKLPEPSEYKSILSRPQPPHGDYPDSIKRIDDLMNASLHLGKYREAMEEQERKQQRYKEFNRRMNKIPFCEKCKDVGCDECSQWPMNQ